EFDGPLDLVIDDASHQYEPTRSSFETLFPLLRTGGLYIIEDWAWAHWVEYQTPDHLWADWQPLTNLVTEIIEALGTSNEVIRSVMMFQGFAVIERGPLAAGQFGDWKLANNTLRRPQ